MEFEDLNFKLHLHIVVKTDAAELVFPDPSLHFVQVLGIQIGRALELIEVLCVFDSDLDIGGSLITIVAHLGIVAS